MSTFARSPQSRPNSAPAYYLARPANWWINVLRQQPHQHLSGVAPAGMVTVAPAASASTRLAR